MSDPCNLYHGFKRINQHGCNVQVNGSLYSVDNPDAFFTDVWACFSLPRRLTRDEYELQCRKLDVKPLSDENTKKFFYGSWDLGTYFATAELRKNRGIPNTLHQIRAYTLKDEDEQKNSMIIAKFVSEAPVIEGELWEPCAVCSAQPVHMPLHLCRACWPT